MVESAKPFSAVGVRPLKHTSRGAQEGRLTSTRGMETCRRSFRHAWPPARARPRRSGRNSQEVAAAREEITAAKVASDGAERKAERLGRGMEAAFSGFRQLVLEPSVKRSRPWRGPGARRNKNTRPMQRRSSQAAGSTRVSSFVRLFYISFVLSLVCALFSLSNTWEARLLPLSPTFGAGRQTGNGSMNTADNQKR